MNVFLLSVIIAAACFLNVKTKADGVSLLYQNRRTLRKVDLETEEYTDIAFNLSRLVKIDFYYEKGLVFWTDQYSEIIFSFVLGSNGPINVIVDVCARPAGVAVDWIHDNLYWTDNEKKVIGVARLDGSLVKTLIHKNIFAPQDIVIDPFEGLIFWTDGIFFPKTERSGTDGTHRTVIIYNDTGKPYTLTIDTVSQAIYWTHGLTGYISTCSYYGTNVRVIAKISSFDSTFFMGLDILGDWLYFSIATEEDYSLYKIDKHGSNNSEPLIIHGENWSSIISIKVYDSSKQIPGVNRCVNNGGCSHLCLPAPLRLIKEGDLKHTCVCPDDVLPSDNCSTIPKVQDDTTSTTTHISNEETSTHIKLNYSVTASSENPKTKQSKSENNLFPTGTIIGITSGIVILALIIFYLHKRFSMISEQEVLKSRNCKGINNPAYIETDEV